MINTVLGVLVSGGGTNLQAIIDSIKSGYLDKCTIGAVVSSKKNAYALERAKNNNISSTVVRKKDFAEIDDYDNTIINFFGKYNVNLVITAGFLSILGEKFMNYYENRIINIHPALIPSFCGKGYYGIIPHEKALEYGVKISGATVQFLTLDVDAGPIILQKAVKVEEDDTPESLQKRVMEEGEQVILPEAIKLYSEGRLKVEGRKVRIV